MFGIVGMPIGMLKVCGNPPPTLEPRLFPPPNTNLDVGIKIDMMGMLTLGTLMEGNEVI
jgi:hypothetical protein